jgi:hypothetical protein
MYIYPSYQIPITSVHLNIQDFLVQEDCATTRNIHISSDKVCLSYLVLYLYPVCEVREPFRLASDELCGSNLERE